MPILITMITKYYDKNQTMINVKEILKIEWLDHVYIYSLHWPTVKEHTDSHVCKQ